jgi:predicted Fe-Mo cluster-binding NifX family protein
LTGAGVTAIVVGGIGGRPLQGLRSTGISVYLDRSNALVSEAVDAFRAGEVAAIDDTDICHG